MLIHVVGSAYFTGIHWCLRTIDTMRLIPPEKEIPADFDTQLALKEALDEWLTDNWRPLEIEDFEDVIVTAWQQLIQLDDDALTDRADRHYEPPNYALYLQSDEWRLRAWRCKNSARYRCQLCDRAGRLHAHHRTYANLGRELPSDLIALCRRCHKRHHGYH